MLTIKLRGKNEKRVITFFTFLWTLPSLFAAPEWMNKQIAEDLAPFQEGVCIHCLENFYQETVGTWLIPCLVTIRNGKITCKHSKGIPDWVLYRYKCIHVALKELARCTALPDITFLISLNDGPDGLYPVPVFVMSKKRYDQMILFPDFDALMSAYQVIPGQNLEITDFPVPWEKRKNLLIWRGAGIQGGVITPENMHTKSRVILCQLSQQYPSLIDAGFTWSCPDCIAEYRKETLSYEEIFSYRYQIWIDGNASSYSSSGWRLYTGSTVLKPDSPNIQWYYNALEPWVHYVPVKEHLEDLVETLLFLQDHENLAEQIARNGLQFAREHITKKHHLQYLHDVLWAYASLPSKTCKQHSS